MKKRNIKAMVTGLVLAAAMAVTPIMAMAATENPTGTTEAAAESPNLRDSAIVTKVVTTAAQGVTVPEKTFTFTATLQNASGSTYNGIKAPTSAPQSVTVNIAKTNENRSEQREGTLDFNLTDIGFYVYRLTENDLGTNAANDLDDEGYGWTKDTAEYQVTIFNQNTGSTKYAIQKVNEDGSLGSKVDTADFNNKFTKKGNKPGTESLKITKAVVNPAYAKDQSWKFDLTFTPDPVNDGILKEDVIIGKIGETSYTFNKGNDGKYSGSVVLTKDQTITFANIPAGTTYSLSESGYEGDKPTAVSKENGQDVEVADGTQGAAYTVKTNAVIGSEGENSVTVTNTYQEVTVTGVFLNNMPFIVMMAAAAAAIFGYVALKRRISK